MQTIGTCFLALCAFILIRYAIADDFTIVRTIATAAGIN